jgi:hypothetical protein
VNVSPSAGGMSLLGAGGWVKYADVDFGSGVGRFTARLAVPDSAAGARIEIRAGGTTGTVLGVLTLVPTGGASVFATQTVTLTASVTGVHSLYLVFQGNAAGAVLDSFTLA